MKFNKTIIAIFICFIVLSTLNSCNFSNTSTTAVVAFEKVENSRSRSLVETQTPTIFDVKVAAVYLSEDIDPETQDNTGLTPIIYLNPACNGNIQSYVNDMLSYFNFAESPETVKEQINASAETIPALTYRYVRIEFYKTESDGYKNVRWGNSDFSSEYFQRGAVETVAFDEPMVVNEGQSVRVILEYNITDSVFVTDASEPAYEIGMISDTHTSGSLSYNFVMPRFHPTAELIE